ncbi:monooxygenase [Saccharopolyspora erythraea]|uniref:acyl-CoA dehydrogenase family protein n=1 Tax=Saccharopolyspora erythraea TaxID=1836 RepID=UPI001BAB1643|nr:acyl-CoA dehydrogenase family protein [Saccharopolyspora erythraea]QUH01879.1 monooxygenase [Saccharopolyspora erythraea]
MGRPCGGIRTGRSPEWSKRAEAPPQALWEAADSKADGSLGQLLGYHYLWNFMPRLWGTEEQRDRWEPLSAENRWFWGAAVNPRDADLVVRDVGDELVFSGRKFFSTGGRVSDVVVLEGVVVDETGQPTEKRVFGLVRSDDPGLVRNDDWDNMGQRLTESGSVEVNDVRVPWRDALGYTDKVQVVPAYATITTPIHQLVFVNMYLGIAQGALAAAKRYTNERTRPWALAEGVESANRDPYILSTYGELSASLQATEAFVDRAVEEMQGAHDAPELIDAEQRGKLEVLVAAAKIQASKVALGVTSRAFEVMGARATASSLGFDRYWRDVRTHTLHDPIAYKLREVGDFELNGRLPEPGWYS